MSSHDWYVQNPAIELVVSNGPKQAASLDGSQQVELGRNILQAGEGTAKAANEFLSDLSDDGTSWPVDVVRGIALEAFTNEKNEIRFKDRHLGKVLQILDHLKVAPRKKIIVEIAKTIDVGSPKPWVDRDDIDNVIEMLKEYKWTAPLVTSLKTTRDAMPSEDDDD